MDPVRIADGLLDNERATHDALRLTQVADFKDVPNESKHIGAVPVILSVHCERGLLLELALFLNWMAQAVRCRPSLTLYSLQSAVIASGKNQFTGHVRWQLSGSWKAKKHAGQVDGVDG